MKIKLKTMPELIGMISEIESEMLTRIPRLIKCQECEMEFRVNRSAGGYVENASDSLMDHLIKEHGYPYEDAALSSGDNRPCRLNGYKTRLIY